MPLADLYLDKIVFSEHFDKPGCTGCGLPSCNDFTSAVGRGTKRPRDCPFISKNKAFALETSLRLKTLLPEVPMLVHPRPGFAGLMEINGPDNDSMVLVSGNNEYTQQILMTVLGTTTAPFHMLFVDTDGNTVDMSMVFKTLTAERVHKALKETGAERTSRRKEMMIPGLASSLKDEIEGLTGWNVKVGPICAAGLPVFLSDMWG